jgi:7 transmembrane helices usually fused to an inactive transglutaminase/Inactive transglutaminase fused to 7 transmembrane helices
VRVSAVFIWAAIFAALGLGLVYLKVTRLAIPLDPSAEAAVWDVEARVAFDGRGQPAKVKLSLPDTPRGFAVLDEDFVSRGYGLAVSTSDGGTRRAVWTIRRTSGSQALYYHVRVYPKLGDAAIVDGPPPTFPEVPEYAEPLASAINAVLTQAREESADVVTFTSLLLSTLTNSDDENVKLIRKSASPEEWPHLLTKILAGARIPSRVVYGLPLDVEFVDRSLSPWVEVHNGEHWQGFDPETGAEGYPPNFLLWAYDNPGITDTHGVRHVQVTFAAAQSPMTQLNVAKQVESKLDSSLLSFSLSDLPVRTQNVYRVLLMVPLGAFVIVLMRMVVGIPTFGTFMPVLVALAFRETKLLAGVVLFFIVVSAGLLIRGALAHLRLLLVPRLTSVLVIVIGLMLAISLISNQLGIEQGLSIALFPMVILTMTIERMSIIWEERGPATAIKEFLGSLVVAIGGYFAMTEEHLVYLMFVFPELLLVVLSLCLMFGAYTGYRLSEIFRFKDLAKG